MFIKIVLNDSTENKILSVRTINISKNRKDNNLESINKCYKIICKIRSCYKIFSLIISFIIFLFLYLFVLIVNHL